jgi:hypothetical protein
MSLRRWLVAVFSPPRLRFDPKSNHVQTVTDKGVMGGSSPNTSAYPANSHSTNCYTLINRPIIDARQSQYSQRH